MSSQLSDTLIVIITVTLILTMSEASNGFSATQWKVLDSLNEGVYHAAVVFANDSLLIVGGCSAPDCATSASAKIFAFNPQKGTPVPDVAYELHDPVVGQRSTTLYNERLYITRACSLLFLNNSDPPSAEIVEHYREIARIELATGEVNDTAMQLPESFSSRANATCVQLGSILYIMGGILLPSRELSDLVDGIDVVSGEAFPNVTRLRVPFMNAAATADSVFLYVAGGVTTDGTVNNELWWYAPSTSENPCTEAIPLPDKPYGQSEWLSVSVYGGFAVVLDDNRTTLAALDIRSQITGWITEDMYAGQPYPEQPQQSMVASLPTVVNESAHLVFFRIGGTELKNISNGPNSTATHLAPVLTRTVSSSWTDVVLPTDTLPTRQVSGKSALQFSLQGANTSEFCSGRESPCKVRLSPGLDCVGDTAGTTPASWQMHTMIFFPEGASYPVYVCFSYGRNPDCSSLTEGSYFVTNPFSPISITDDNPTPTNTPSPSSSNSHTSLNILLYVLGGIAALTTIIAVLLVARLRRLPFDEGMISNKPVVGYGTHQDERYRIISKIGEGAFSVVYLVVRRADGQRFAMKHMECQSDLQRQEAIKECEIMRTLQGHPNVINLVDMFMNYEFDAAADVLESPKVASDDLQANLLVTSASGGSPKRSRHLCLVMEYHPGGDLRNWTLQLHGPAPEPILCSVAFQICSVLKHIHSQDPPVIHRDLKPENVLIASTTNHPTFLPIVVTDFGLARVQDESHCASGAGTLPYVAPECFKKKYSVQCDMWSLGCVLYAVAARRVNSDTVRLMFQEASTPHFHETLRSDLINRGRLSEVFTTFILELLEPDPQKRITAHAAFRLFRKKGELVYITNRILNKQPPSTQPTNGGKDDASSKLPRGTSLSRDELVEAGAPRSDEGQVPKVRPSVSAGPSSLGGGREEGNARIPAEESNQDHASSSVNKEDTTVETQKRVRSEE